MARVSGYTTGDLPDAAVAVLACLAEPRHGYAIMSRLDEFGGPELSMGPATLYTTLKKLRAAGLIEELDGDGARRPYRRTAAGTEALRANVERRRRLIAFTETSLETS